MQQELLVLHAPEGIIEKPDKWQKWGFSDAFTCTVLKGVRKYIFI